MKYERGTWSSMVGACIYTFVHEKRVTDCKIDISGLLTCQAFLVWTKAFWRQYNITFQCQDPADRAALHSVDG